VDDLTKSDRAVAKSGPAEVLARPILRVEGISKSFPGQNGTRHRVLNDVSLSVLKGEVLVIIGPSGSGKSTLLRCINLLTIPDSGSIEFLDKRLTFEKPRGPLAKLRFERDLCDLRRQIGMVFQHFNLFPHRKVLSNVMLALMRVLGLSAAEARERALKELERVGMAQKVDAYPNELSGGQKQRVAIARAMAMRPEIMMFDEATSALDPEITKDILGQMKKLAAAGMTMIVVTHEIGFAREVGNRIILMDWGRIVEEGPAKDLVSSPKNQRTQEFLRAIL
jgi:ABC-type polar amino acid transport system ATPase subunit